MYRDKCCHIDRNDKGIVTLFYIIARQYKRCVQMISDQIDTSGGETRDQCLQLPAHLCCHLIIAL